MENEEILRILTDQNNGNAEMLMDLLERVKPKESPVHPGSSDATHELDEALALAQGEIGAAHRDADNPFHNSKYAELSSCWDACRAALSKNGISVRQFPVPWPGEDKFMMRLVTKITHSSGQWESGIVDMRCQKRLSRAEGGGWVDDNGPQTVGAIMTYARRYGLCAMVGIAPADSDAETLTGNETKEPFIKSPDMSKITQAKEKAPDKEAKNPEEKKEPVEKTGDEPPPVPAQTGNINARNVKKLNDALEKAGLAEEVTNDLFQTFNVEKIEELGEGDFIKFMRCISKAKEIQEKGE